jgi:hypothetical protein
LAPEIAEFTGDATLAIRDAASRVSTEMEVDARLIIKVLLLKYCC